MVKVDRLPGISISPSILCHITNIYSYPSHLTLVEVTCQLELQRPRALARLANSDWAHQHQTCWRNTISITHPHPQPVNEMESLVSSSSLVAFHERLSQLISITPWLLILQSRIPFPTPSGGPAITGTYQIIDQ